jgi:hypothetical protein
LVLAAAVRSSGWLLGFVIVVAALVNGAFLRFAHREKAYFEKLQTRIDAAGK